MTNIQTSLQPGMTSNAGPVIYQSHHLAPVSSIEYRIVFALVFAVCLCLAVLNRLLPRGLRFLDATASRCGLICEAKNAAQSTVPYIFQV